MEQLNYNRFFHLHTVSGIVISVGLYVIFFAGAFTLFEDDIHHWEEGSYSIHQDTAAVKAFDYDKFVNALEQKDYDLYGRDIFITLEGEKEQHVYISKSRVKDTLLTRDATKDYELMVNTNTYAITEELEEDESFSLGTLLYWLHFFSQIKRPIGMYLSGLIALFFLFAIVSGVIVHWKKIIPNFYTFRPLAKLKTIWTDAHTVLGVIGLPFQFVYALTGAMFCLGIVIMPTILLYDGDIEKVKAELGFQQQDSVGVRVDTHYQLTQYVDQTVAKWKDFVPTRVTIKKYAADNMQFSISGFVSTQTQFLGKGSITYHLPTSDVIEQKDPQEQDYFERVHLIANGLHYADYGRLGVWSNYGLKMIYFIMALITCFVIISGVLIWLTARNKKS